MLTYAYVSWRMLTYVDPQQVELTYADVSWRMLTCADPQQVERMGGAVALGKAVRGRRACVSFASVAASSSPPLRSDACWRMLTHAGDESLTYADAC